MATKKSKNDRSRSDDDDYDDDDNTKEFNNSDSEGGNDDNDNSGSDNDDNENDDDDDEEEEEEEEEDDDDDDDDDSEADSRTKKSANIDSTQDVSSSAKNTRAPSTSNLKSASNEDTASFYSDSDSVLAGIKPQPRRKENVSEELNKTKNKSKKKAETKSDSRRRTVYVTQVSVDKVEHLKKLLTRPKYGAGKISEAEYLSSSNTLAVTFEDETPARKLCEAKCIEFSGMQFQIFSDLESATQVPESERTLFVLECDEDWEEVARDELPGDKGQCSYDSLTRSVSVVFRKKTDFEAAIKLGSFSFLGMTKRLSDSLLETKQGSENVRPKKSKAKEPKKKTSNSPTDKENIRQPADSSKSKSQFKSEKFEEVEKEETGRRSRAVMLQNVDEETIPNDKLQMILENKRYTGCSDITVDKIIPVRSLQPNTVIVLTETINDAERLINTKQVEYKGLKCTISIPSSEISQIVFSSITVTEVPLSMQEDILDLIMVKAGDVKECRLDRTRNLAVVTYEAESVAEEILKKGQVKHKGYNLKVREFRGDDDYIEEKGSTILVRGVPQGYTMDDLELIFENKRFCSGEIKKITPTNTKAEVLITYCDKKDAEAVLAMGRIKQGSNEFIVERPKDSHDINVTVDSRAGNSENSQPTASANVDSTVDDMRLLLKYVPESATDLELSSFLSSQSKAIITSIQKCTLSNQRLVTFKTPPDFNSLVGRKQFLGSTISIDTVQKPREFIITGGNFSEDKKEVLQIYFENTTQCDVTNIVIRNRGCAIIEFKSVIDSACSLIAGEHHVNNMNIKIQPYYSFLDYNELNIQIASIPDSITVDIDSDLCKFVTSRGDLKNILEKRFEQAGYKMIFSGGGNKLELQPLRTVTEDWTELAKTACKSILSEIVTKEISITKTEHSVETLKAEIAKFEKEYPRMECKFICKTEGNFLSLMGLREDVEKFEASFETMIARLQKESEEGSLVEDKINMSAGQYGLMNRADGFFSNLKEAYDGFSIAFNSEKSEYVIKGKKSELSFIKSTILEKSSSIESQKLTSDSDILSCLKLEKIEKMIAEELNSKHLQVFFSVSDSATYMHAYDRKDFEGASAVIKNIIHVVTCRGTFSQNLVNYELQRYLNKLKEDGSQLLHIRLVEAKLEEKKEKRGELESTFCIYISGKREQVESARAQIEKYIGDRQIVSKEYSAEKPYCDLLVKHKRDKLRDIAKNLSDLRLPDDDQNVFILQGSQSNVDKAYKDLINLLCKIEPPAERRIENGEYFTTTEGRDRLDGIGRRNKVYIDVQTDSTSGGATGLASNTMAGVVISKHGQRVSTFCGNIGKYKADAIVLWDIEKRENPVGLCGTVLKEAGIEAWTSYKNDRWDAKHAVPGDSFIVSEQSISLECKAIIIGIIKIYSNGQKSEQENLHGTIRTCLDKANSKNYNTVAVSYVDELFKYSLDLTVDIFLQAMQEYFNKKENCTIQNIVIVDADKTVIDEFENRLATFQATESDDYKDEKPGRDLRDFRDSFYQPKGSQTAAIDTDYKKTQGAQFTVETQQGMKVSLGFGSIVNAVADALVNTCNPSLDLTQGAVSKSLLTAAGKELQDECNANKPTNFSYGQFVRTKGYKLKCKNVYNCSIPGWDNGAGATEKIVRDIVAKILLDADKSGFTSIVFPALGTGNLKIPPDLVASILFEEVAKFSKSQSSQAKLKEIQFFIYDQDKPTIDAFKKKIDEVVASGGTGATGGTPKNVIIDNRKPKTDTKFDAKTGIGSFGPLKLHIKQGDITKEVGDVVVCPSNATMNLKSGQVSKAILNAAGPEFVKEINRGKMGQNGIYPCSGCKLPANYVFILNTFSTDQNWAGKIRNCLLEADNNQLSKIIFPLLGSGNLNVSPSQMGEHMADAMAKFLSKGAPKCLDTITICIFDQMKISPFTDSLAKKCATLAQGTNLGKTGHGVMKSQAVILQFYGFSQSSIQSAIYEADKVNSETKDTYVFEEEKDKELIKHLTSKEKSKIQSVNLEEGLNVDIHITSESPVYKIVVAGKSLDVIKAVDCINKIFQDIRQKRLKEDADNKLKHSVQWYYMKDDTWITFPDHINANVEFQYSAKKEYYEFPEDGTRCRIDFKTMEETIGKNKHRVKRETAESGYPAFWAPMKESDLVVLVDLDPTSQEFKTVEANAKTTDSSRIKDIVKIQRIQNKRLYNRYQANKQAMERELRKNQIERKLWHGTSLDTVQSIYSGGLNRNYCGKNLVAYGTGSYFAVNFEYSARETYSPADSTTKYKHVFQCLVLTGDYTQGVQGMLTPPKRPLPDVGDYDSVVDNPLTPGMFIVFYDNLSYPEYLITFVSNDGK